MTIQELGKTQEGAGQEAIGAIPSDDLNITAPGKLRIIKRNGKVVPFEEDKIKVAVTKAFLANESGNAAQAKEYIEKLKKLQLKYKRFSKEECPQAELCTLRRYKTR